MAGEHTWAAQEGVRLEPYGLDIAPELAELAWRPLPRRPDRIYDGNARLFWLDVNA